MIEELLLAVSRLCTYRQGQLLTNATGFFFHANGQLFLVTSRHVMFDEPSGHCPDQLEIELHTDASNLARSATCSIALYQNGSPLWRQGVDHSGAVDVALIPIAPDGLPATALYRAFTPEHLNYRPHQVEVGSPLLIPGFPLGFHDQLHHMPVVRQAIIASSFGLRFQGEGYFLTDARTHRGSSGAPVVLRMQQPEPGLASLPWCLLGVHSARLDVGSRDSEQDEGLGLNCAWYADILLSLVQAVAEPERL